MRELALQLEVALPAFGRQGAVGERRADRAAGLGVVRAVREFALVHELRHVGERLFEPLFCLPELQLAETGRVDQDAASRKQEKLTVRRRMAAAPVLAHLAR